MGAIKVWAVLGHNPGFTYFEGIGPILGSGSYSPLGSLEQSQTREIKDEIYQASSPSILSLSGGSDYRGIYDIGFKRGFMGYVGLLLNAPYKIDSMMGMRLMSFVSSVLLSFLLVVFGL
jgi:hypothetical protein